MILYFRYNIIKGDFATAFRIKGNSRPIIQYNQMNTMRGIKLEDNPNTIDARFNWWGTTNPQEIEQRIEDGHDRSDLGLVEFAPWLLNPEDIYLDIPTLRKDMSWGKIKKSKEIELNEIYSNVYKN